MAAKIKYTGTALAAFTLGLAAPAHADQPRQTAPRSQSVPAAPELTSRANDLVRMINGELPPGELFSPQVLSEMSAAGFAKLAQQLRSRRGRALGVDRIEASSPRIGTVFITFQRAVLPLRIQVQAQPPHLIMGLQTRD
jgi:hypothetical protein